MIQEYVTLEKYNSLGVHATARYFAEVYSLEDVAATLRFAQSHALPVFVLGGGSNIVLARNWDGLMIHVCIKGISVVHESDEFVTLSVGAGEVWHDLVTQTVSAHRFGLENLALIPGTVGAAPVQNIGAYGVEMSDFVVAVTAVSLEDGKVHRFPSEECAFSYRHSIFHGQCPNTWLITGVELRLHKQPISSVTYPSLITELQKEGINPAMAHPVQVMEAVMRIRTQRLPNPKKIPNVGSFFKNPIIDTKVYLDLKEKFPDITAYPAGSRWKISAGWLLEKAGYKGVTQEGVGTYKNNALVIINPRHRSGEDVLCFAEEIQRAVAQQFGVSIEIEPLVIRSDEDLARSSIIRSPNAKSAKSVAP